MSGACFSRTVWWTTWLFRRCRADGFICDLYRNTTPTGSTWRMRIFGKFLDFGRLVDKESRNLFLENLIVLISKNCVKTTSRNETHRACREALKSITALALTLPWQNLTHPAQPNICCVRLSNFRRVTVKGMAKRRQKSVNFSLPKRRSKGVMTLRLLADEKGRGPIVKRDLTQPVLNQYTALH